MSDYLISFGSRNVEPVMQLLSLVLTIVDFVVTYHPDSLVNEPEIRQTQSN